MSSRRGLRTARVVAVGVLLIVVVVLVGGLASHGVPGGGAAAANPQRSLPADTPTLSRTHPVALVGFGDSVMSGAGCTCQDFLAQAAGRVRSDTGRKVSVVNNGANGETAADVLEDLQLAGDSTREIAAADVIVLTIGANDLVPALNDWQAEGCDASCYGPQVSGMANRMTAILAIINATRRPGAQVLVTNYWNVFEDGDVGAAEHGDSYLDWSDQVTRAANAAICRAAAQAQAACVDLYQPFKGVGEGDPTQLLAADGDHPNARGTELIAATVAAAIMRRLPS